MVSTDANRWKSFRKSTAAGVVFFLVMMSWAPAATAKARFDWSRVEKVVPGTKTTVVLYTDRAPQGKREVKGRFHSATPESISVTLVNRGQTRTLSKQAVFKAMVDRPPYEGWITAGGSAAIFLGLAPGWDLNGRGWALFGGLFVGLPTAIAFLVSPKMKTIYNLPRKLRDDPAPTTPPTATRQGSATSGSRLLLLEDTAFEPELLRTPTRRPLLRERLLRDLWSLSAHAHRAGTD